MVHYFNTIEVSMGLNPKVVFFLALAYCCPLQFVINYPFFLQSNTVETFH